MSTGTRGERPASGSGTLWGGKPADTVSTGSSRTSHGATPAPSADEKRLGATETCIMAYIKTGETAETPEPKGTAAVLGAPSSPRDCSFVRPAESTPRRGAIASQIMFERVEQAVERRNRPQILILYLNVYSTSSCGTGDLSDRYALRGDARMPACGREGGGGVVAKRCPVMGRTG